jgi:hypothetical protein
MMVMFIKRSYYVHPNKVYEYANILNVDLLVYLIWREAGKRYSPKREKI